MVIERNHLGKSREFARFLGPQRGRRQPGSMAKEITKGGYPLTTEEYLLLEGGDYIPSGNLKVFTTAYVYTTPGASAPAFPGDVTRADMVTQALAHDVIDDRFGPEIAAWISTDPETVRREKRAEREKSK